MAEHLWRRIGRRLRSPVKYSYGDRSSAYSVRRVRPSGRSFNDFSPTPLSSERDGEKIVEKEKEFSSNAPSNWAILRVEWFAETKLEVVSRRALAGGTER